VPAVWQVRDAIGRKWQCSTVQLDFNLPQRFDMKYTDSDSTKKQPIMVHRAIFGSIERFFGILIENYAGRRPGPLLSATSSSMDIVTGVGSPLVSSCKT
jgi:threonyl-tRNA synthetase